LFQTARCRLLSLRENKLFFTKWTRNLKRETVSKGDWAMADMEGWDLLLLVVVGYLAVHSLIRLMVAHRNRTLQRLREKAERLESENTFNSTDSEDRRKIAS
jgi:hypothetical protein